MAPIGATRIGKGLRLWANVDIGLRDMVIEVAALVGCLFDTGDPIFH